MAYDRSKRFPKLVVQTPAIVGPGTYDYSILSKPPRDIGNCYPFSTGAKRNTLTLSKDVVNFPGPAAYDLKDPRGHIRGGVSIDFTEARFKERIPEGPGPADYDLPEELTRKSLDSPKNHCEPCGGPVGKLYLARPPRPLVISGLSVPTKRDSYGYGIKENGALVKIVPSDPDPVVFYNIPRGETCFNTIRYKGNFWSRMTGRQDMLFSSTPGPGDYEHETTKSPAEIQNEKIRESKRATSRQSRYLDDLCRKKLREGLPAPNAYDPPKTSFDQYNSCKCDNDYLEHPPCKQSSKRFQDDFFSDSPGPGTYEISDGPKCSNPLNLAPFGSTADRFKKDSSGMIPASNAYLSEVGNIAYKCWKRLKYCVRRPILQEKIHINSTMGNDYVSIDFGEPSPRKTSVYHAAFKSRTKRIPDLAGTEGPSPCAYDVSKAFKISHDRCDFHRRPSAPTVGSSTNRFTKSSGEIDVPGPERYDIRGDMSKNVRGGAIPCARKSTFAGHAGPSPFHYRIHPSYGSSVLRRSFNVTLGKREALENMKRGKCSRLHRRSTRKVLRCFALPLNQYRHC